MTIVPDTNVIVSGFLSSKSAPFIILNMFSAGVVNFAVSEETFSEYEDVLRREKFAKIGAFDKFKVDDFLSELEKNALFTEGRHEVTIPVEDETDKKFLACAVDAEADAVVTGDNKHLLPIRAYKNIPITTPRQFVESIAKHTA